MRFLRTFALLCVATFVTGCGKPIPIEVLRQRDFVQSVLDSQPQTQGKAKVSIDDQNKILIELDVFVGELPAFRDSFESIHKGTSDYIKQEAQPFVVKTKNETFSVPNQ